MSENQNIQETPSEKTTESTTSSAKSAKQQKQSSSTRIAVKYALLSNLMFVGYSISEVLLSQFAVWFAGATFGIDDAGTSYIHNVVYKSAFAGFAAFYMLKQLRNPSEDTAKSLIRKLSPHERKLQQGIGLGIMIAFIAIGLIAIKDGAILRSASMAFTLAIIITSFCIGVFFARYASHFFAKGVRLLLSNTLQN